MNPTPFTDPHVVADYTDGPPRIVPGYHAVHRMAAILMAERAPEQARVLVLGAGGGLELKAFAETHPGWSFCGVDPSAEMLDLARTTLGPLASRVDLHTGYIDTAPAGPFDAATALLTLHFLEPEERLRTLTAVHRRLAPGAPLVVAHAGFPDADPAKRDVWLSRYAAFAIASGVEPDRAAAGREAFEQRVSVLSPEQDEALLREAGFGDVTEFYTAFTFRGWVAFA